MCKFSSKSGGVPFQPLGDLTWNDLSAVAVDVAIVVFSVTWVFVANGELTGTGRSAAFDVRVVIEMRGVVLHCQKCKIF